MDARGRAGHALDVVRVHVEIDGGAAPPRSGVLRARVEDAALADAPATIVDRVEQPLADGLDVELPSPARAGLTLRIHLDVDGSGRISPGDFISVESIALPPSGDLVVRVRQVP